VLGAQLTQASIDMRHLLPAWEQFRSATDIAPIRDEAQHHSLPEASGTEALKFLMTQHGLKQGDLPEIGSQGIVSGILTRKTTWMFDRSGHSVKGLGYRPPLVSNSGNRYS
jgi:hypothetical protein